MDEHRKSDLATPAVDNHTTPANESDHRLWLRLQMLEQQRQERKRLHLETPTPHDVFIVWPAQHDMVPCDCGLCDLSAQSSKRFLCLGKHGTFYGSRDLAFNFESCEVAANVLISFQDKLARHRVWPMYKRAEDLMCFRGDGESETDFEIRLARRRFMESVDLSRQ